jgi:hypothetical protein
MVTVSGPAGNEVAFDEQPLASVMVTSTIRPPAEAGAALLTGSVADCAELLLFLVPHAASETQTTAVSAAARNIAGSNTQGDQLR